MRANVRVTLLVHVDVYLAFFLVVTLFINARLPVKRRIRETHVCNFFSPKGQSIDRYSESLLRFNRVLSVTYWPNKWL